MFVRQINSRLSRNASEIDENVLEYLNERRLDLQSGLSIASLLSLSDICEEPHFIGGLATEPEIIRDCSMLTKALATGLADLHKQFEVAQKDSFTMEQVLKKTISTLENANEAQRLRTNELMNNIKILENQLRANNENYERRMKKAREHLQALGLFESDNAVEESLDRMSESSMSREQRRSRSIPRGMSKENAMLHVRTNSGVVGDKICDKPRSGPYVAQVISGSKNKSKSQSTSDLSWTRPWALSRNVESNVQRGSREYNSSATQDPPRSKNFF